MIRPQGARWPRLAAGAYLLLATVLGGPAAEAKRPSNEEAAQAFTLFLNAKEDIVTRCIYRPDERKVVADALKMLAQDLGPSYTAYFPADPGPTFPDAWKVYQSTLVALTEAPGLEAKTVQQLVEQSLRVLCRSFDRYSDYDDLGTWEKEKTVKKPDYIGVGMTIERTSEGYDCYPFPGGPADLAGLLAGDRLVEVDGKPVRGRNQVDVGTWITGKEGTSVKIKLRHLGEEKETVLTVKREQIRSSFIEVTQSSAGATVRLRRLSEATVRDLKTFLRTAKPKQKFTLDFRGCHGGDLSAAIAIAELFLPAGSVIGKLETRNGPEVFKSANPTPYRASSFVILQDKSTMSGAELITAALVTSSDVRAESRGERTYGKGVTIAEIEVKDGGRLRIADARIYGPHGEFWDGEGLNPTNEDARPK